MGTAVLVSAASIGGRVGRLIRIRQVQADVVQVRQTLGWALVPAKLKTSPRAEAPRRKFTLNLLKRRLADMSSAPTLRRERSAR